ncbi:hypothetical protein Smp_062400 [Schistosoma mansoni]|uniref:hypothetical protein n=1 Tax=Schistosoma mansoni TaxID=6183 RepID=UPI0001A63C74|nr:hypothetical protein Smp_062400 [Schistosoma mansoni]|eukprot:XP_018652113.1 hypothetical protein Smp_062400 [Schistosoma mansoni]
MACKDNVEGKYSHAYTHTLVWKTGEHALLKDSFKYQEITNVTTYCREKVTQTTPTVAKTITTDYKQYGCNTREINYKFNQLLGLFELISAASAA